MRVTYSNNHNFIVRCMPGSVHQAAHASWSTYTHQALRDLFPHPQPTAAPGCDFIAASDSSIVPIGSKRPSIVMEVGSSESLTMPYHYLGTPSQSAHF
ncbi:hypothetical protein K443DRAFT_180781 [Laccaria amethystina LaAM-08-1]|uniref:Uncharacterized protein n=1 Tax=Laccaria amethystina LaAM-08-1 TaxID=1095629 RepID=A0A0C9XT70_9AGAR|nr:hypothetical protein K443DRAFT_180781 [Laccaria amethystina LaAM-08-1]